MKKPPPLNDPRIRLALIPWLLTSDPDLWIREEMGVHGCVADLVTVSRSELHIYEIKSDVDSTTRLEDRVKIGRGGYTWTTQGQVTAYSAMADRVTLVVGTELLEEAKTKIPPWWGILVAVDEYPETVLVPYRDAIQNPDLRWVKVFEFLWRAEAQDFCERLGIAKGVRGGSKARLKKRLKEKGVTLDQLRSEVRRVLRIRQWDPKYGNRP